MIKAQIDVHLERKLTHIIGVFAMAVAHHLFPVWICWTILTVMGLPLVVFDFLRLRNKYLHDLTPKIFGRIMRRRELNSITGTTYLLIGVAIIFAIFPHDIVSLSLLFLAFADPIASYVGLKYGSHRILGKKTFEGSLAAFVVCVIISGLFFHFKNILIAHFFVATLLAGLIGGLSELIPIARLDDNLTQPVVNAIFLFVLFYLFGGFS
jgi:dolichol kinase